MKIKKIIPLLLLSFLTGCASRPVGTPTVTPIPVTQAIPTTVVTPTNIVATPTLVPTLTPTNTPTPDPKNTFTDREIIALNTLFGNEDRVYGYYTRTEDEVTRVPDPMLDTLVDGYSMFTSAPNISLYFFTQNKEEYIERYEFDMNKETGYYVTVDYLTEGGLTAAFVRGKSTEFYDSDFNKIEPVDNFHPLVYDQVKEMFRYFCEYVKGYYTYTTAGVVSDGGQFFWFEDGEYRQWQIKYETNDTLHEISIVIDDNGVRNYYRFEWSEDDILTGNELALLKE